MPFVTEILESFIQERYNCEVVTLCPQDYYPEERDCFIVLHPVFSDTIYVIVRDGVSPHRANACKLIRYYKRHGYDCRGFMERDCVTEEQLYCMTSCINFRKYSHHDCVLMREIMKVHVVPCHYTLTHYKCKDNKHYCMIYAGGALIAKACWVSARRCSVDFCDGRKMEFTADPMLTENEHAHAKDLSTFVDNTQPKTSMKSEKYTQGAIVPVYSPVPLSITGNKTARSASNIVKPSSYKRTMEKSVNKSPTRSDSNIVKPSSYKRTMEKSFDEEYDEPSISFEEDVYVVPSSQPRSEETVKVKSRYLNDAEEIFLEDEDDYEEFETTQRSPSRKSNVIEVRGNGSLYDAPPSSDKSALRSARSKSVTKPKTRNIQFRSSTIV